MKSPFIERSVRRGQTGHGNVSEKRVAKSLAAQSIAGSGSQKGNKGDMKLADPAREWLVEAKATRNETFPISLAQLVKISFEALAVGRVPALTVSFTTPEGKARPKGDWVMVPMHVYKELIGQ